MRVAFAPRAVRRALPRPTGLGVACIAAAALGALVAAVLLLGVLASPARAETTDVRGAIYAAAAIHGVDPGPLIDLVDCETGGTFDADAAGDHRWRDGRYVPTSRGPAQINDLPTGLARHYYAQGYTDRTDAEQAADYLARISAGEWASEGVTLARWSCPVRRRANGPTDQRANVATWERTNAPTDQRANEPTEQRALVDDRR